VKWGWIATNPAVNATLPRLTRSELTPPLPSTTRLLLRAATERDPALGTLLLLAASTAMRRGELCGLKWGDIDLDSGRITVTRSIATVADGTVEKSTKTHSSRRLALDPGTVQALREHHKRATEVAEKVPAELNDRTFVFSSSPDGHRPTRENDKSHEDRIRRDTGECLAFGRQPHAPAEEEQANQ
jgi:integrase